MEKTSVRLARRYSSIGKGSHSKSLRIFNDPPTGIPGDRAPVPFVLILANTQLVPPLTQSHTAGLPLAHIPGAFSLSPKAKNESAKAKDAVNIC